jgi:hypothetical protein
VTFFGTAEDEARRLEDFRKRQRRIGLKPLPRYVPSVPPPNDNNKKMRKDSK